MFLSIIIPIYNDEKYLRSCLNSCLKQDIPTDDYEIICVDDGSTDSTPFILKEYESQFSNIRVVFQKRGAANGRNVGLEIAQGDYVWFVDHDDLIEENVLSELKKCTQDTNCEKLVFPFYEFVNELTEEELRKRKEGTLDLSCTKRFPPEITIWSSILNRRFLQKNNLWPRSKQVKEMRPIFGGDEFFAHECNDYISNSIHLTDRPFYFYRKYFGSESHKIGKKALDWKLKLYYNRSLSCAEKAVQWREQFEAERQRNGRASAETTVKMIRWLRASRTVLADLPASYWHSGNAYLKQCGLFVFRKPEEYGYTCRQHLQKTAGSGESVLKRAAFYYSYGRLGTSIYRLLDTKIHLSRAIQRSETLSIIKRKLYKKP